MPAETLAVLIEQGNLGAVADLPYARPLLEELAPFDVRDPPRRGPPSVPVVSRLMTIW